MGLDKKLGQDAMLIVLLGSRLESPVLVPSCDVPLHMLIGTSWHQQPHWTENTRLLLVWGTT